MSTVLEVLSLVITAVTTFTIAVLTAVPIVEQRRLRREAVMPVVIAYLELDPDELNIINFLVRNVGGGVAQSIELRTTSNVHVERLGLSGAWKPIGSLPQGGVYKNFLGSAALDPPAEPLEVEVAYSGSRWPKAQQAIRSGCHSVREPVEGGRAGGSAGSANKGVGEHQQESRKSARPSRGYGELLKGVHRRNGGQRGPVCQYQSAIRRWIWRIFRWGFT